MTAGKAVAIVGPRQETEAHRAWVDSGLAELDPRAVSIATGDDESGVSEYVRRTAGARGFRVEAHSLRTVASVEALLRHAAIVIDLFGWRARIVRDASLVRRIARRFDVHVVML